MELKDTIVEKGFVREQSSEEYSDLLFALPVPKSKITQFGSRKISPAHTGQLNNSIDFIVPEGTGIYAAADGIVFAIKDDSKVGGPYPKYWDDGNYIEIKHSNGEFTRYEHLKFKGVIVKVGEKVKQGQLIGYSGHTGFANNPHLHFEVMNYYGKGHEDYVTMKARFKDFPDVYENE